MTARDLLDLSSRILDGTITIEEHHPVRMDPRARLQEVADGVAFVESFANVTAVRTGDGLVLVDAGGPFHAPVIVESVRGWTDEPLHTAVYTHGHVDHIYAVKVFEAEDRGDVRVLAHDRLPERFRRYEMTNGYNAAINQRQFQLPVPLFPGDYRYPDETYSDRLDITVGDTELSLRHDRGETDDHTWVWLPESKVLATGDLFIWGTPNCGNPQKAQRYCDDWARALRKMAALRPEVLLPGHGLPIAGVDRVVGVLEDTARYLESLFEQTIELMNQGATLDDVLHTVAPPADLVDRPWLQPVYDEPEFIVRNIWRLYGGWYDGDPSTLKPAPRRELAAELAALAGGAHRLAERARELSGAGDHRLAGHLAQIAADAHPDAAVHEARAAVFGARAAAERSTMAKGVFAWAERESSDFNE